jgi:hypothetical protein
MYGRYDNHSINGSKFVALHTLHSLQKFTIMTTQEKTMTTQEIATRLAELCRLGQFETAQKELYADDIVSLEPYSTPEFEQETKGLDAIIEKGHKFESMVEVMHDSKVSEPIVADNSFAFTMTMDATFKGKGRMKMTELCVYQVKDGKVSSEQFFM